MVDREVDAGGCAARRDASFFDTTRSTRKDRADGASRRASRARAKKRAGRKGTKKDRLARRGKRRRPRRLRTGGLPRVPRGRASRAPSCVSATGRIPHPRIVRLPHPRRSSSRVRLDAEEQTAGGITWELLNAPARKKNKERCLLQADACSRGAPTECLSRDASPIFLATPGARRSAALGRRRSARRVNVNGRNISPLPKSTPRWRLLRSISRFPGISSASRVKSVARRLF